MVLNYLACVNSVYVIGYAFTAVDHNIHAVAEFHALGDASTHVDGIGRDLRSNRRIRERVLRTAVVSLVPGTQSSLHWHPQLSPSTPNLFFISLERAREESARGEFGGGFWL